MKPLKILLLTPPMIQLNTPYPATPYLTGYLRSVGFDAVQDDPAIRLILRLFCKGGLGRVRKSLVAAKVKASPLLSFFTEAFGDYENTIDLAVRFLQGHDQTLELRIAGRNLLPEGPRFQHLSDNDSLAEAFGVMGTHDQAKYIASLYLDDLSDVIREGVDERFQFSRYAEQLASCQLSFDPLYKALLSQGTLIDELIAEITAELLEVHEPDVLGLTLPFPGNVYGGFKIAQVARSYRRKIQASRAKTEPLKIVMGGGFVNTELRELSDARVFEFVDAITLDDGERPLELLLHHFQKKKKPTGLLRTLMLNSEKKVTLFTEANPRTSKFSEHPGPTYEGLPLAQYLSMFEMLNPVHRLWSDYRWNKLMLAHGCYWHKCTFCDTKLDYISRYEPLKADSIIEQMLRLTRETGQSGFHFIDEAAPPALLRVLSQRLIERQIKTSWWGNLRFEKMFAPELCELMSDAGCIAVTGGIEVASERLLKLINKGVDLAQVAQVTKAFSRAGIYVHAYLMYGFPSQTEQETVDSLEVVRQLFQRGCIQSGFWHRFAATIHSPVGHHPEKFGIELVKPKKNEFSKHGTFAQNDIGFIDPTPCNHDALGEGLRRAVYNFMHGIGLDEDVRTWFNFSVKKTSHSKRLIEQLLRKQT